MAGLLHDERAREDVPIVLRLSRGHRDSLKAIQAVRLVGTSSVAVGEITRPARSTETQSSVTSAKRTLDLYALWTIDRNTRLRFSASNVLARDYSNSSAIVTPASTIQSVEASGPTWIAWQVRLEMNL